MKLFRKDTRIILVRRTVNDTHIRTDVPRVLDSLFCLQFGFKYT